MAVVGAPVSSLDTAGNAVRAAREMIEAAAAFSRDEAGTLRGGELRISVGVHLGEAVPEAELRDGTETLELYRVATGSGSR